MLLLFAGAFLGNVTLTEHSAYGPALLLALTALGVSVCLFSLALRRTDARGIRGVCAGGVLLGGLQLLMVLMRLSAFL